MFDIFKRKKVTQLPNDYQGLIDEKGYKIFLDKCLFTLKELGYLVQSYDNGDIKYLKKDSDEAHFYLDNILRKYIQADDKKKDQEIIGHFTKLKDQTVAYEYLYKDFDYAKQFLKVQLKADDILPNNDDFVYQKQIPYLLTFLVLDFEDQFHYVNSNEVKAWEVSTQKLFEIALSNVSNEKIDIKEYIFSDKYTVFALFSGDFSASYCLLLEEHLEFAIGDFGTLLSLPTKGSTFLYPINGGNVLDVVATIYPTIEKFFNEDPGNLTLDFYWFYMGQFQLFEKTQNKDGTVTINIPKELKKLLS